MKNIVNEYIKKFKTENRNRRRVLSLILVLAVLVSVAVPWQLHSTGIAMTNETFCGLEEHEHTDECYEMKLVCGYDDVDDEKSAGDEKDSVTSDTSEKEQKKDVKSDSDSEVKKDKEDATATSEDSATDEVRKDEAKDVSAEKEDAVESAPEKKHVHTDDCYKTEKELICGKEETEAVEGHTHTDECYDDNQELICDQEEREAVEGHTHSDDCYKEMKTLVCEGDAYTVETEAATSEDIAVESEKEETKDSEAKAGKEETKDTETKTENGKKHVHTKACYERVLVCDKKEHKHTIECLTDDTADVETADDWKKTLPELSGVLADDVVAVAKSQIGYKESTKNYILGEDEKTHKGYTRYGEWYGNKYGDWNAMFAAFVLHYAEVPEDEFPQAGGVYAWIAKLKKADLYVTVDDGEPAKGDLVFLDLEEDDADNADHVAVVAEVKDEKLVVIEGDCDNQVQKKEYSISDQVIRGYGVLPKPEKEEAEEEKNVNSRTFTAEDGGIKVTVEVPEDAVPENAELSVTHFAEDTEEYREASEAIALDDESEMAAIDISFLVDGEKVEPTKEVAVSIDVSEILPEEADMESVVVQHLEEKSGTVEAVTVADVGDQVEGTVDTDTAKAEFTVDSFSTFTVQWNYNSGETGRVRSESIEVKVYVRPDRTSDPQEAPFEKELTNRIIATNSTFIFDDTQNELVVVDGYKLAEAKIEINEPDWWSSEGKWNSYNLYSLRGINTSTTEKYNGRDYITSSTWKYTYKREKNGDDYNLANYSTEYGRRNYNTNGGSKPNVRINLYYTPIKTDSSGNLEITDTIKNNGQINAQYKEQPLAGAEYYYKWYRSEMPESNEISSFVEVSGEITDKIQIRNEDARHYYYVELYQSGVEIPVAVSKVYQVPYYGQLRNGGFEDVSVADGAESEQIANGLYSNLVWKTTGPGSSNTIRKSDGQDIEIVRDGKYHGKTSAYSGDQFAEINAEANGTLYQDVLTTEGQTLYWSAAHKARNESTNGDTMVVIIMSTEDAEKYVTKQEDINLIYNNISGSLKNVGIDNVSKAIQFTMLADDGSTYSGTLWVVRSDNRGWNYWQNREYEVPAGQHLTRFMFGAIRSYPDTTEGNLLDEVSFNQHKTVTANSGLISVTKKFDLGVGNSNEVITKDSFKFQIYKGNELVDTVYLPTANGKIAEENVWTVYSKDLTPYGDYRVVETDMRPLAGYKYDSTSVSVGGIDVKDVKESRSFVLNKNTTESVTFTNSYKPYTTDISIKKVDSKKKEKGPLAGAKFTLSSVNGSKLTYYNAKGQSSEVATELISNEKGIIDVEGLVDGTYELTETSAPQGYILLTEPIEIVIANGQLQWPEDKSYSFASIDKNDKCKLIVENDAGRELPQTGGSGTLPYALSGLATMGSALMMGFGSKRRRERRGKH